MSKPTQAFAGRDLFLRAARGEKTERTPVWLMRQAGRILPEYRELRAGVPSFKHLVETPDLVQEVTLQPIHALGVDAAIIFSDILVIPEAMGLPYRMQPGKGPIFDETVNADIDVEKLRIANPAEDLSYTLEGLRKTRAALAAMGEDGVPLIGFAGAPWTIMAYMIEGGGSKTFSKPRRWLHANPGGSKKLLEKITESTLLYLQAQVKAGAQALQLFDSWAGVLSPALYREFALPAIRTILNGLKDSHPEIPVIVFAKDAWFVFEDLAELPSAVMGLDWQTNPELARKRAPGRVFQGNLDPTLLYADPKHIEGKVKEMLAGFGASSQAHIANLGHGVYPDTPLDGVRAFIGTVQAGY